MKCGFFFHYSMMHKMYGNHKCNWKYAHTAFHTIFPANNSKTLRTLKSDISFPVLWSVHTVASTQKCQRNFISSFSPLYNNHYEVLGLKQSASPAEIKSAFFELSKLHHPDKLQDANEDSDMNAFLKIRKAYDVLHNKKRRTEYDMKLFGRSSQVNRFSSGEYVLRGDISDAQQKSHQAIEKNQFDPNLDENDASSNENGSKKLSNFHYMAKLLSTLYGVMLVVGIAMYLLGKYVRNREEIKEGESIK